MSAAKPQKFEQELSHLDATLETAEDFCAAKEQILNTLKSRAENPSTNRETAYELWSQIYSECSSYNVNRASKALDKQDSLARAMGNKGLMTDVLLKRANLLCKSGNYLEARQLSEKADTASFSERQRLEWWIFNQAFNTDFAEYSPNADGHAKMLSRIAYYRKLIIDNTEEDLPIHNEMIVREFLRTGKAELADSVGRLSLSTMNPSSHEYAQAAYWQAVACRDQGKDDESLIWFIHSAIADTRSAIKDNASLFSLAQILFQREIDIQRAFQYTHISLNDALFYNSKLRSWQITQSLPAIEQAFISNENEHSKHNRNLLIAISGLAAGLLWICILMLRFYRKLNSSHRKISAMNEQIQEYSDSLAESNKKLSEAIGQLSEANAAKEEYIALFLSMCSDYIDKLGKHLKISETDAELKAFYKAFDNAFLQLYPNFIEEFNALLRPEARTEPKKNELLNTELRIFALIRLGITQSSHIASLLRYSVNTIYNYRAQVKNSALTDREDFEEIVKKIGSAR